MPNLYTLYKSMSFYNKIIGLFIISFIITFFTAETHGINLSAENWFNNGVAAYNTQTNSNYAVDCFTQTLAVVQNYVPALIALGDLYAVRGCDEKAKQFFLHAIQNHRDSEYAVRRLADLYKGNKDIFKEVKYLQEILPKITNNYLRLLIKNRLAGSLFFLGKLDEGNVYLSQLPLLTNWMVVGGFDNNERTGLRKKFKPETNLSLNQIYKGKEWDVNWRKAFPLNKFRKINFKIIRPQKWIAAYLRTGIISPHATSVVFHLSFSGAFRMWMNGKPIVENTKYRTYKNFMYRIPVELKAGTNLCVFKLCMEDNNYIFSVNLTTLDNSPLFLENIQPDDNTVPLQCGTTKKWSKPLPSPGITFREKLNKTSENLYNKIMLGRYYYILRNFDEAIKQIEKLMKKGEAGAVDLYFLGKCYTFKNCGSQAIAAFRSGFAVDPLAVNNQTAIAAHYADRSLYDLAQPILEEVLSKNTNCLYARLVLINLFKERNWNEDAFRLAQETCRLFPDYAKAHNSLERASRNNNFDEIRERALKKSLDCRYNSAGRRFNLSWLLFYQRRFDDLFEQIEILENLFPYDPQVLNLKLRAYISLRDITNSFKICKKAIEIFPDNFEFHKNLGDLFYMDNKRENAIDSYHTALKYYPSYLWLRQYLDFLEGRDQAFFDKYSFTEKQVKNLVEKYQNTKPVTVEEISKILLKQHLVQVFSDGSSRHLFHFICKVLHPKSVKKNSSVYLPGGASGRLLRAVTYKKDGRIIESTHLNSKQIEFPDVQVGDTIEYKCMWDRYGGSWMDEHFYATYTFGYNQSEIVKADLVLAFPTNKPVCIYKHPENVNYTTSLFEKSFVRHWTFTNIPMFRSEPLAPSYYDLAHRVTISTITNWSLIANWQRGMVSEITRGNESVTMLAEEITKNATSDVQKIELIFNYITENFRYTRMYENRIAGIKPHPIPDILANRCGDCKDLSLLMVEMLKAVKIPASFALTRSAERGEIIKNVPTPDVFNHAIVYIPQTGEKGFFVDPTYRLGEFDLLHSQCQNVEALIIDEKNYILKKTSLAPPENCSSFNSIKGEIFSDGTLTGAFKATFWRNDAAMFRQHLENISKIRDIGSYIIGKIDSRAMLLDFNIENKKAHTKLPFIIDLTFSSPQFAHINNSSISFTLPLPFEAQEYLNGLETRRYPLKFKELGEDAKDYIFKLPDGFDVDIAEKDCSLETKFGSFNFKITIDDSILRIKWKIVLSKQMIEVEEYPDFRSFLAKISHVTSQVIALHKK